MRVSQIDWKSVIQITLLGIAIMFVLFCCVFAANWVELKNMGSPMPIVACLKPTRWVLMCLIPIAVADIGMILEDV